MRADVRVYSGIFFVILAALAVILLFRAANPPPPKITNFSECSLAGYPVLESYPRQCKTPSGKIFFEAAKEEINLQQKVQPK